MQVARLALMLRVRTTRPVVTELHRTQPMMGLASVVSASPRRVPMILALSASSTPTWKTRLTGPESAGALAVATLALALWTVASSTALSAQATTELGERPPRWSVETSLGTRLPGTFYNEFITRTTRADSLPRRTRWKEFTDLGLEGRVVLRLNPQAGAGLYIGGIAGWSSTLAQYSGSLFPPEDISRSTSYYGVNFGVGMKLTEWAEGRGQLEYNVGAAVLTQVIDLKPGHRNALAQLGSATAPMIDWRRRTSTAWGLDLGTTFRIPVGEASSLRLSFRDLIVPVNTAQVAEQERDDVNEGTGERVAFRLGPYTSHQLSLSAGFEYTFSWGRARREVTRILPDRAIENTVDASVANAMRIAAEGDTTTAIAALEHRVNIAPHDAYAWRELSLLQAVRAEFDASVRNETLSNLERALNMNPGDTELLRAYGRIRGLVQREGRVPEAVSVRRLELSELAVQSAADGSLRLGWAARGLELSTDGSLRYAVAVEVFDSAGESVPIGSGMDGMQDDDDGGLRLESAGDGPPLSLSIDLFLVEPLPGIYTARVRLTDLSSGASVETSEGFEIP